MDTTAGMFEVLQNGSSLNAGALGSSPFATGWISSVLPAVSSVAANGNRSYNMTFAATVAPYITPGQRLRTTRTVAAPTQCTSLNGATQFYSKTSPAGMTFTDNFTAMGWVKLSAYQAGGIITRFGTSGWMLRLNASGQVEIYADNGVTSRAFQSYQSLPLNKWVHVAASLNMAGAAGVVYLDGVSVPVASSGGAGTVLVQNGNINIGAWNGANFLNGKVAQAAVFSAILTQSTIQSYISQGLVGTETSLISAYSFNNSINDLNANANNLTANGSAVATNADSPFGGQATGLISSTLDYAIVTAVSTTVATVQVPEGCTIPTTGGVTSVDLSAFKVPYGFPADEGKWTILFQNLTPTTRVTPANGTWYYDNNTLTIPIGAWAIHYGGCLKVNYNATADNILSGTLSTSQATAGDPSIMIGAVCDTALNLIVLASSTQYRTFYSSFTTQTPLYFNIRVANANPSNIYLDGGVAATVIQATCAHL